MEQAAEVLGMSRQTYALIEANKKEITVSQAESWRLCFAWSW